MPKIVLQALTLAPSLALALALKVQFWAWKLSVFNGLYSSPLSNIFLEPFSPPLPSLVSLARLFPSWLQLQAPYFLPVLLKVGVLEEETAWPARLSLLSLPYQRAKLCNLLTRPTYPNEYQMLTRSLWTSQP